MKSVFNTRIVVLLWIIILRSTAEKVYYVSNQETTSVDVGALCTLGEPNITFTPEGASADVTSVTLSAVSEGEEIWTGRRMKYMVVQYIGCVKIDSIKYNYTDIHETMADPGECLSVCTNTTAMIGMTFTQMNYSRCLCFARELSWTEKEQIDVKRCEHQCVSPAHASCGGYNIVSLYTAKRDASPDYVVENIKTIKSGDCVLFDPKHNVKYWTDCNNTYFFVCQSGPVRAVMFDTPHTWRDAAEFCYGQNKFPASATLIDAITSPNRLPDASVWTGMFRTPVLLAQNENINDSYYATIGIASGAGHVVFDKPSSNTSHKHLCQRDINGATETPIASTGAPPVTTDSSGPSKIGDQEDNLPLLLLIVVAVAIFVLIVVVIIMCLVWRKRRRQREANSRYSVSRHEREVSVLAFVYANTEYSPAHNRGNQSNRMRNDDIDGDFDMYSTVTKKKADVIDNKSNVSDNVYNHMTETGDIYDHAGERHAQHVDAKNADEASYDRLHADNKVVSMETVNADNAADDKTGVYGDRLI